ncbi:MAG: hypothetical protein IPF72_19535 [Chitinophagaceae bacterium]|nr:hypothetical protein [Chitinophagaceae bacterium]
MGELPLIDLSLDVVRQIIEEINGQSELTRRALVKRRHDIYKDGGKHYLIEQIKREFDTDALDEMRLAPVNLLKKIINKKSTLFKKAPVRKAINPKDQVLVDYYTYELKLNTVMQKANRYYNLFSNTVIYTHPNPRGELCVEVVAPYLYSIKPNSYNQSEIDAYVFNCFTETGIVAPQQNTGSATGFQSFSQEPGYRFSQDKIASNELNNEPNNRMYMFWSDTEHFTANKDGERIILAPELGPDQFYNPIGRMPVVNLAKDRDNESWATQGEDMVDLTIAIQMGWTDLLTIAKHQGFATPVIMSEEKPQKMIFGVNKGLWLQLRQDGPTPSVSYVQPNSPLDQYKGMLLDLLALLFSTNDMDPRSVGGVSAAQNFTSGFHALIAASDNLEAVEADKPVFQEAEQDQWEIISKWHNYLFDAGLLEEEARQLGKFTDTFEINVQFAEVKPLESEDEVIDRVMKLRSEGLITKKDALKKLNPDLSEDEVMQKLADIQSEASQNYNAMADKVNPPQPLPDGEVPPVELSTPEEQTQQ